MIYNIIEDNELYVTEFMKIEFFEYLKIYNGVDDVMSYCDNFFDQPKSALFDKKKYLLKGEIVGDQIYDKDIGRVTSKQGFSRALNTAILNSSITDKSGLLPISDAMDETLVNLFTSDFNDSAITDDNMFFEFLNDTKIAECKIQDTPMWTFDAYFDEDVFKGYDLADLPCILGLPGPDRTETNYLSLERLTFSLRIPKEVNVRKPTSFDAGLMSTWRCGGKTVPHPDCRSIYGNNGFAEYIHEPIQFKFITSIIYKI